MSIIGFLGTKHDQIQGFLRDGTRVPISRVVITPNIITQIKSAEKEGYTAVQLGFGTRKNVNKPLRGHSTKAGLSYTPRFLREARVSDVGDMKVGSEVKVQDVFKPGDIIDVTGTSKGKGFAGVVKRYKFAGGPRTHGQSDRERAPGSIGQSTTPGRVYRGKRMAGKMGNSKVTVKNLEVLDVADQTLSLKGLIPGHRGSLVMLKKVGENKTFIPLYQQEGGEKHATQ